MRQEKIELDAYYDDIDELNERAPIEDDDYYNNIAHGYNYNSDLVDVITGRNNRSQL